MYIHSSWENTAINDVKISNEKKNGDNKRKNNLKHISSKIKRQHCNECHVESISDFMVGTQVAVEEDIPDCGVS